MKTLILQSLALQILEGNLNYQENLNEKSKISPESGAYFKIYLDLFCYVLHLGALND